MDTVERLKKLIEKSQDVLDTHVPESTNIYGFPTLDSGKFKAWKIQVLNLLENILPPDNHYLKTFQDPHNRDGYVSTMKMFVRILETLVEDVVNDSIALKNSNCPSNHYGNILLVLDRFHHVARQLRDRHNKRKTIDIDDEYDVQDLLHALLKLYFDDIRAEEWTPSYAGQSARMDFLIKSDRIVIETKKTRKDLSSKGIGNQLIEDIERYKNHSECDTLICFIYDPEGFIGNPRGMENDLNRDSDQINVKVFVKP